MYFESKMQWDISTDLERAGILSHLIYPKLNCCCFKADNLL